MPVKREPAQRTDTGTGEVKPIGVQTFDYTGDLEGPTGEAKSTLARNVVMEEHKGEPTGDAEPTRSTTVNADWPAAKEAKAPENKQVKSTENKTTAKKTTRRKKA